MSAPIHAVDPERRVEFLLPVPDIKDLRAGNTGVAGVWRFDSGRPGRHVMISALVHGNELCGAWALKGLLEAGIRPIAGRLTLAFCNLAAFDRFDPARHDAARFVEEDLNRQWSAARMREAGTLERRRAAALAPFVAGADWLLDLHSMHEPSPPLCLTGPLEENVALALRMGTPGHIVVDGGHQDGVRMRDYGRFGSAQGAAAGARALLIECGFHGDPRALDMARDQCARLLGLAGVVEQSWLASRLPGWRQPGPAEQVVLEVTGAAVASGPEVRFSAPLRGLECIPVAGTVIGHDGATPIRTPHNDCVLVMPSLRQARPGVTVVRFARRRVIPRDHAV